jgi:transposase-like protein
MRKRYTRSQHDELLHAVRTQGKPVPVAAARLGVVLATAYNWVRDAGKASRVDKAGGPAASARPSFVELVPVPVPRPPADGPLIVRVGAAEVVVPMGFDAALLRAVVDALAGERA